MTIWAASEITVTSDHLKLLSRTNWIWEHAEYGAAAIDPKRPFGNSNVDRDIMEILGRDVNEDEARGLALDLVTVLSLASRLVAGGTLLTVGRWRRDTKDAWARVDAAPAGPWWWADFGNGPEIVRMRTEPDGTTQWVEASGSATLYGAPDVTLLRPVEG
jgi:hypothetical protein